MSLSQDLVKNFSVLLDTCKEQLAALLNQSSTQFNELFGKAQTTGENLQKSYVKALDDVGKQTSRETDKTIARLNSEYETKRSDLERSYDSTRRNSESTFQKNMSTFDTKAKEIFKQAPMIPDDAYKNMMSYMGEEHKKLVANSDKTFQDIMNDLARTNEEFQRRMQAQRTK